MYVYGLIEHEMNQVDKEKLLNSFIQMVDSINSQQNELIIDELKKMNAKLDDVLSVSHKKFMRASDVENVYGIKRSSLELYVSEGIITKHKMKGLALFSVREIEDAIVPVR